MKLKEIFNPPIYPIERKYFIDRLSQGFGIRNPRYRLTHTHIGCDFAVPVNTPVRAMANDTIVYHTGKDRGLGYYCHVSTKLKGVYRFYRFLHLKDKPKTGVYNKGDIIARTGNTGDSDGPHLHMERWKGTIDTKKLKRPADVFKYLEDPYATLRYEIDGDII